LRASRAFFTPRFPFCGIFTGKTRSCVFDFRRAVKVFRGGAPFDAF
jgi:hypothetical protein